MKEYPSHIYMRHKKETQELLFDLSWEWDRMSSSGKETLNKLFKIFDIEEMEA